MTGGMWNMMFWQIVFKTWTMGEVQALTAWALEIEELREPVE